VGKLSDSLKDAANSAEKMASALERSSDAGIPSGGGGGGTVPGVDGQPTVFNVTVQEFGPVGGSGGNGPGSLTRVNPSFRPTPLSGGSGGPKVVGAAGQVSVQQALGEILRAVQSFASKSDNGLVQFRDGRIG
jgi:hypothetical protein